jgi:hypothetical protein
MPVRRQPLSTAGQCLPRPCSSKSFAGRFHRWLLGNQGLHLQPPFPEPVVAWGVRDLHPSWKTSKDANQPQLDLFPVIENNLA